MNAVKLADLAQSMSADCGHPDIHATTGDRSISVGSSSVSCAEYPYGFEGAAGGKRRPSKITHVFRVTAALDGSMRGVILLTDKPSMEELRRLLETAGLSPSECTAVTEGFGIAGDEPLEDRLYRASDLRQVGVSSVASPH